MEKTRKLTNAVNFRPLGGQGAAGCLRPGLLYRSGDLSNLTSDEATYLRSGLGLLHYIDMRTDRERACAGPPIALVSAGVRWHSLPVDGYDGDAIQAAMPSAADYARYYLGMLRQAGDKIVAVLCSIAEWLPPPLVFGCSAGKDRTGVLAMALLTLLGCNQDVIIADYAASAVCLTPHLDRFEARRLARGITREHYLHRIMPTGETMAILLRRLDEEHGGIVAMLRSAGMHPRMVDALRRQYAQKSPTRTEGDCPPNEAGPNNRRGS